MGIIRKQYFGISDVTMSAIKIMWDLEWEDVEKPERARIVEIEAYVLIGLCRVISIYFYNLLDGYALNMGRNKEPT